MPPRPTRSRFLLPLVLPVWFAVPVAAGRDPGRPWWVGLLPAAISLLLGYAVRDVVRLWRAPTSEAGWRGVVANLLVGGLSSLTASSMVLGSPRWESRLTGWCCSRSGPLCSPWRRGKAGVPPPDDTCPSDPTRHTGRPGSDWIGVDQGRSGEKSPVNRGLLTRLRATPAPR